MRNNELTSTQDVIIIQATTFFGALITYVMPVISMIFMLVSIVSGCILIYKFFTNKK
jgi:hypothetical protein